MKFKLEPFHRNISDETLLNDLRRVAKKLGSDKITIAKYKEHGKFNSSTLQRRFGGWLKTLEKAELKQTRIYGVSDEEYFRNLENVWATLGRQPYYGEMEKPLSKYSKKAYCYRFGTWRKALEAFINYINSSDDIKISKSFKKRTVKKKHKTSRDISWRMRFLVMRRDDFRCRLCGASPALKPGLVLHVDHIIPWINGGETVVNNLQTLCEPCNVGKSNLDLIKKDNKG